jgi:hypothetical protein
MQQIGGFIYTTATTYVIVRNKDQLSTTAQQR